MLLSGADIHVLTSKIVKRGLFENELLKCIEKKESLSSSKLARSAVMQSQLSL